LAYFAQFEINGDFSGKVENFPLRKFPQYFYNGSGAQKLEWCP